MPIVLIAERLLRKHRIKTMSNLIQFAQGRRWSDPISTCPQCSEGQMRRDNLAFDASDGETNYAQCDKCGFKVDLSEGELK